MRTREPRERARTRTSMVAAALAVALVACAGHTEAPATDEDPTDIAQDGIETSSAESDAQLLTTSFVATSASGSLSIASASDLAGGSLATTALGDGTRLLYFPRGCLTVKENGATHTLTYTFTGCTGPNGLGRITGEVEATYVTAPGKLTLDLVGTKLQVNRSEVEWSATSEITSNGAERTMHWRGTLTGATARGRAFSRTTDKTVTWRVGERCLALSGSSEGRIGARDVKTDITDYQRCQGTCPEGGGRIDITNARTGNQVEIRYDGTNRATVVGPHGQSSLTLACGA